MLTSYFRVTYPVTRLRGALAGRFVDGFAQHLEEAGFKPATIREYLRVVHHLSAWTEGRGDSLEVDLVVSTGDRALTLIEAKASRTVTPAMAEPLVRLGTAVHRYDVTGLVVHRGTPGEATLAALRPGVKAVPVDRLLSVLASGRAGRAHARLPRRR